MPPTQYMSKTSHVARNITCLIFIVAWGSMALPSPAQSTDSDEFAVSIRRRMESQVVDWNRGDIDSFMKVYWRSPKLSFSSGGKTVRGWQPTLERYKSRYPDRQTMGQLTFSDLEITELGDSVALVLGKWHLQRTADAPHGNFSLVFRKLDGQWVIVHDHTSLLQESREGGSGEAPSEP